MPAKDSAHDGVKRALVKDGWAITDEQVRILANDRYMWIDRIEPAASHATSVAVVRRVSRSALARGGCLA
jgi:hypothetical protein